MAARGCSLCFKILVILFNIILLLIGMAILGIGIWMLADPQKFDETATKEFPRDVAYLAGTSDRNSTTSEYKTIKTIGIIAIVAGGVVMGAAGFGFVGAATELVSLLSLNILTLLLLLLGVLFVVFFIFIFGEELDLVHGYSFFWDRQYRERIVEVMQEEINTGKEDGLLKIAYEDYKCCGIYRSNATNGRCEYSYPPKQYCSASTFNCRTGCLEPVAQSAEDNMKFNVGMSVLAVGGFIIIAMMLSITMCCCSLRSSRSGDYEYE